MTMRLISILLLAISIVVLAVLMVMRLPGSDYFSATCRAFMDYHGVAGNDGFNFKGDISFSLMIIKQGGTIYRGV
ncbi:hypothetical protein ACFSKS_17610 [Pseudocitrobacter faecalis]